MQKINIKGFKFFIYVDMLVLYDLFLCCIQKYSISFTKRYINRFWNFYVKPICCKISSCNIQEIWNKKKKSNIFSNRSIFTNVFIIYILETIQKIQLVFHGSIIILFISFNKYIIIFYFIQSLVYIYIYINNRIILIKFK